MKTILRTGSAGLLLLAGGPWLARLPIDFLDRLPGLVLRPLPVEFGRYRYRVSLTEGGSRTYRIWLDSAPTEQVTVAVTAPSKVSVNPASMTFTTGNWSTPQTVTLEASHDNDTSDETQYVTHRATKGGYTTTLSRVQVEITDDDDGEDQIGSRPSGALWWAALTARRETGGATGHIDYTSPHADTGKHPGWQAGQAVAVKLTRTDPDAAPEAGPGLSVADARVREAEGAALSFRVTLDAAQDSTVSVRYATADGTAVAGADYETASGVVRFAPGETAKTVSVAVLNDAHDEGSETLTLALSRPFGAELGDGTATGTIVNTGPIPKAWIARFGRTVGLQALEAIGDRVGGSGATGGTQVVVGGVELVGSEEFAGAMLDADAHWPTRPDDLEGFGLANDGRGMTGRELLLGSSFRFGAGGEAGGPSWAAWGRFATSGSQGEEADLSLSGDVTTGFLGADVSLERGLAGLAVGVSEGEGSFGDDAGDGTVESSLTSVFPYARLAIGEGLDIWGLVGAGSGDLTLAVGEEVTKADLSMRMGALGLRGEIVTAEEEGDFGLAWKSDALWVRTESAASRSSTGGNLEAASGDVSRVRVPLEGSRAIAVGSGSAVTPTLEIGLHHDGGDAETGAGVEAGFGLQYSHPAQGLTVDGRVRGLLAHSDGAYEEWGASGSLGLDPGISGRGVSLAIVPVWGAASDGVEQLWSTGTAAGLAADDGFDAPARLQAELGYGLRPPVGQGVLTPYAGFSTGGAGRTYRLGVRWRGASMFQMALEGSHGEADGDAQPATAAATLSASYRW